MLFMPIPFFFCEGKPEGQARMCFDFLVSLEKFSCFFNFLDFILTRLTVIGAAYLAAVCILPEILISQYSIPFYLGGTSLLIVVTVSLDTVSQIQSHLLAHQYEGLIKKAQIKGRR